MQKTKEEKIIMDTAEAVKKALEGKWINDGEVSLMFDLPNKQWILRRKDGLVGYAPMLCVYLLPNKQWTLVN